MTDLPERVVASEFPAGQSADSTDRDRVAAKSEQKASHNKPLKASFLSSFFASTLSIFETHPESHSGEKKPTKSRSYGWTTAVKKVVAGGSMRRLQDRLLGTSSTDLSLTSEIWLLGKCYKLSPEESSGGAVHDNGFAAFFKDFSSRIWITYRKG